MTWRQIIGAILLTSLAGMGGCGIGGGSGTAAAPANQDRAYGDLSDSDRPAGEPSAADIVRARQTAALRNTLALPTIAKGSSVIYVERLSPDETRVSKPYEYQIKVTNLSNAPVTDVVVREKLPRSFKLDHSEPAARLENEYFSYAIGDLDAHQTRFVHVYGTPNVEGKLNSCIAVTYTPLLCTTTDIVRPEVKIAKEGPESIDICQPLVYRYIVRNVGTGTAQAVKIEDSLPEGMTTMDGRKKLVLDAGDLGAGRSRDFSVRVKAERPGRYSSPAIARGPDDTAESEPLTTQVGAPKLVVAMSGPKSEYLNRPAVYQVVVTNKGDAPARQAMLKFTGTAGATLLEAGPNHGRLAELDVGTIAPGKSVTISASFRGEQPGPMRLVAHATAACADEVLGDVTTTIMTAPALRLEMVDLEDPVRVGDDVVYRVTVTNQGTGADHDIHLTGLLPDGLRFVRSEGPTEVKSAGPKLDLGNVPLLEPGKSISWKIEARASGTGEVQFQISLTSRTLSKAAVETEPTRLYERP